MSTVPARVTPRARAALASPASPWPWIAVAALAVVAHLNVLPNPFVFDDWYNIPDNPYMVHPQGLRKMFGGNVWDFLGRVGIGNYYRPLMHLFHYAIYRLFGPQPGWFHLFCLLLHATVSLLVVALVRRLSGRHGVGVLAGLLFTVHPIHTEVLAWISCSPELLSSLFSLLTLILYLKATEAEGRRRVMLALAMGASLLVAQLSKEIGVMVPAVVVSYELLVRRRGPWQQVKERWPEYTALGVATLVYLALRVKALGGLVPVKQQTALAWPDHLWTCLALFYRYMSVTLLPTDLNFFRYYAPQHSPFDPLALAGLVSLGAFVALGVWLYRRRAPEVLGLPFYLLTLIPVFQLPYIFTGLLMVERAAYLPSVGFCWLAAAGLMKLHDRFGARPAAALAAMVLIAYAGRSAARMPDWRDEVEITREGLAHAPGFFHMHSVRGEALLRHDRPLEAVASLEESLRLREDYADAQNHLGRAYLLLNQPEAALRHYRRAAELCLRDGRPDSAARAWNNIGIVHRSLGNNQEAIAAYREAVRLDPDFAAVRNNLGFVLLLEGRVNEALAELRAAIRQDAALAQAHANLGLAHALSGQWSQAMAALAEAERLAPNNPEVHARIGDIHLARGEAEAARRRFRRALQLQPQNPRALAGMAAVRRREAQP